MKVTRIIGEIFLNLERLLVASLLESMKCSPNALSGFLSTN